MFNSLTWVVVPGGPGLSSGYLEDSLPTMFSEWDLKFYEPLGAHISDNCNVSIEDLINQLEKVIEDLNDTNIGVITHSFGNYLALRLLERGNTRVKAMVMINPLPFSFYEWKEGLDRIIKKVPVDILNEINVLSELSSNGNKIFELIYPYYIGQRSQKLPIDVLFNMGFCNIISSQVKEFDDRKFIEESSIPIVRIIGEQDPFLFNQDMLIDNTILINGVGHYPFFEDPNQFTQAIKKAQELLCQKV